MWSYGKEKIKNISKKDIKNGAKEITEVVVENGVEVVKSGIFGIVNGVIIKIVLVVTFIIIITSAGCVGTNMAINTLTSEKTEVNNIKK